MKPIFDFGWVGVDLFFALSGFILSYTYRDRFKSINQTQYFEFLKLRIARIYPVHLTVLFIVALMVFVARRLGFELRTVDYIDYSASSFTMNLFMVHAWWSKGQSFYGPAWSISMEFLAYIMFPFLIIFVKKPRKVVINILGVIAAYAFLLVMLHLFDGLTVQNGVVRIIGNFTAGCFLFEIYRELKSKDIAWGAISVALVGVLLGGLWLNDGLGFTAAQSVWLIPVIGCLMFTLAFEKGSIAHFLGRPRMVWGGEISYSVYMTHILVSMVAGKLLSAQSHAGASLFIRLAIIATYLVAILGSGIAMHYLIERPGRTWIRSLSFRRFVQSR